MMIKNEWYFQPFLLTAILGMDIVGKGHNRKWSLWLTAILGMATMENGHCGERTFWKRPFWNTAILTHYHSGNGHSHNCHSGNGRFLTAFMAQPLWMVYTWYNCYVRRWALEPSSARPASLISGYLAGIRGWETHGLKTEARYTLFYVNQTPTSFQEVDSERKEQANL